MTPAAAPACWLPTCRAFFLTRTADSSSDLHRWNRRQHLGRVAPMTRRATYADGHKAVLLAFYSDPRKT